MLIGVFSHSAIANARSVANCIRQWLDNYFLATEDMPLLSRMHHFGSISLPNDKFESLGVTIVNIIERRVSLPVQRRNTKLIHDSVGEKNPTHVESFPVAYYLPPLLSLLVSVASHYNYSTLILLKWLDN